MTGLIHFTDCFIHKCETNHPSQKYLNSLWQGQLIGNISIVSSACGANLSVALIQHC